MQINSYAWRMSPTIRQAFGNRVRAMRMEQGVSLRKFALMIGIDKGFLVDIEYGRKSPTLDTIVKVANGLGVSLATLFEELDTEAESPQRLSD